MASNYLTFHHSRKLFLYLLIKHFARQAFCKWVIRSKMFNYFLRCIKIITCLRLDKHVCNHLNIWNLCKNTFVYILSRRGFCLGSGTHNSNLLQLKIVIRYWVIQFTYPYTYRMWSKDLVKVAQDHFLWRGLSGGCVQERISFSWTDDGDDSMQSFLSLFLNICNLKIITWLST